MENLETGLSAGEQRIFFIAMTCTTDGLAGIKVNYDLLAEKAGLKNAACASVLYGKARRKLLEATRGAGSTSTPNANGTDPTTPAKANKVTKRTPKSSSRGKNAATKAAIAAATLEVEETPTKARKIKNETHYDVDMTGMMRADVGFKQEKGNGGFARIKSEFANGLANEMIEGTSYPRSELEWSFFEQSLWHVETYKSESEDGSDTT
ncbi:uncharacterized protein BDCG_03127 [Blastomyces dermatitidis ER-3]|uniref:Uncharacterized protein n=2 Tax=Blastomyces TaxID=229219 RepID=A0A179UDS0_BLAGS|nr:uncharacterized protein BDBG_02428 [Blastomyces gilchristii SLH14081]XP_045275233.1 uncharacterized protein BDCG_03127 [Blastomyces dermatitidis ER-3]EEQ88007.1 hypothetical protein BDCG_03127 [Blastomyces dermatitidis ER-3]OAT06156.1 hypothetical protein BDBG_02428 [Blastomyces gilchristii SLH14081]